MGGMHHCQRVFFVVAPDARVTINHPGRAWQDPPIRPPLKGLLVLGQHAGRLGPYVAGGFGFAREMFGTLSG